MPGEEQAARVADMVSGAIGRSRSTASAQDVQWAVRRLLESLARVRPLVVAFDDIQWAESPLLDLIQYLAAYVTSAPVGVVCLARDDLLERRPGWETAFGRSATLRLRPLSDTDSARLLRGLAGRRGTSPAQVRVAGRSRGQPALPRAPGGDARRRPRRGDPAEHPGSPRGTHRRSAARAAPGDRGGGDRGPRLPSRRRLGAPGRPGAGSTSTRRLQSSSGVSSCARPSACSPASRATGSRTCSCAMPPTSSSPRAGGPSCTSASRSGCEPRPRISASSTRSSATTSSRRTDTGASSAGSTPSAHRALAADASGHLRAAGLRVLGAGDRTAAANLLRRAAALRAADDPERAAILIDLGGVLREEGRFDDSQDSLGRGAAPRRRAAVPPPCMHARRSSGCSGSCSVDPDGAAREAARHGAVIARALDEAGDHAGLARLWHLRGAASLDPGAGRRGGGVLAPGCVRGGDRR